MIKIHGLDDAFDHSINDGSFLDECCDASKDDGPFWMNDLVPPWMMDPFE